MISVGLMPISGEIRYCRNEAGLFKKDCLNKVTK